MVEDDAMRPTAHSPGTHQKLAVMRARATAKLPLFHPDDHNDLWRVSVAMLLTDFKSTGRGPRGGYVLKGEKSDKKVRGAMRVHRLHMYRKDHR